MIMQLLHTQLKQLWWYLSLKKNPDLNGIKTNGLRVIYVVYIPVDCYNNHLLSTPPILNSATSLYKLSVPKATVTFEALKLNRPIRLMNYEWTLNAVLNVIQVLELKFLFFIKVLCYIVIYMKNE